MEPSTQPDIYAPFFKYWHTRVQPGTHTKGKGSRQPCLSLPIQPMFFLLLLFLLNPVSLLGSEAIEYRLLRYEQFATLTPGAEIPSPDLFDMLDYLPGEQPFGVAMDLNMDGHQELLLGSPEYRLCGNAGCPYLLIDGNSKKLIGDFFGTVALSSVRINGYPVVHTISRLDQEATNLQVYVFDGTTYQLVAHNLLEARGMESWWENVTSDENKSKTSNH